jgi:hypothetical protein
MFWNHRVMRRTEGGTKHLYIVEVYYEDFRDEEPPSIMGWTESETVWCDEEYDDGIEGLRRTLTWMLECLDKPILDEAELLAMAEEARANGTTREPEEYETYNSIEELLAALDDDEPNGDIRSWEDEGGAI